jgi:arylsulfatase
MWEGGARVPCIMRWPGRIQPDTVCDKLAATIDILPTIAEIADAPLPEKKIDGVSILPLLRGDKNANPRQEYYYYYANGLEAVRQGQWKLHFPHSYRSYEGVEPGRDGWPGPYGKGKTGLALYDLHNDIGERNDVKDQHPEIVAGLQELGEKARQDLGDSLTKRKGPGVRECGTYNP